MKRLVSLLFALCLFPLFAELYPARRYVELGFGADAQISQNAMPLKDIFKKTLVLDLKKIASDMSDSGLTASLRQSDDFHLDFNFKKFGFGIFLRSEFSGSMNVSKDLFDVLGKGMSPGTTYSSEGTVWAESFVSISVPVRFNVGKLRARVEPACFSPLFYVPSTTVTGRAANGLDGSVTVTASAPITIYTPAEFKGLVKDGSLSADFAGELDGSLSGSMAKCMGFDVAALVEYPLKDTLDVGGYANVPIVPARLRHKVTANASLSVTTDSLLNVILDDAEINKTAEIADAEYSSADYAVNRPLRLGAECAWRPAGKWLTMRAAAGFGLRNPFGEDVSIKSLYPEYRLGVEIVGIGMFGLSLSTEYTRKVFAHSASVMLNFRAVEFDFMAAVCSPTFVQSFKGEGLAAGFAAKFGW